MSSEIPVLDLSDYMAGKPGAREAVAADLRQACENIGFFFISGHGIDQDLPARRGRSCLFERNQGARNARQGRDAAA